MKNTKIEWATHTWNAWIGCTKVSPGCANCYAAAMDRRWGRDSWGPGKIRHRTSAAYWRQPLVWNKQAGAMAREIARGSTPYIGPKDRPRVFCASLADWLDYEIPTAWRVDLLALIEATPHLDWLLLTKRPESWNARMHEAMGAGSGLATTWLNGSIPGNVWVGASVENQEWGNERIPHLLKIPARVRFLSCEPLLGPVDLVKGMHGGKFSGNLAGRIDWVICGGESGCGARSMHPDWARSLRDQCANAGVAFFFKQWGEYDANGMRVGKHAAGRLLDGKSHDHIPASPLD